MVMNLNNKKILVTGGAGFVGSNIVTILLGMGAKVTVLDNLFFRQNSLLGCCSNRNFKFLKGDATNCDLVKKILPD